MFAAAHDLSTVMAIVSFALSVSIGIIQIFVTDSGTRSNLIAFATSLLGFSTGVAFSKRNDGGVLGSSTPSRRRGGREPPNQTG